MIWALLLACASDYGLTHHVRTEWEPPSSWSLTEEVVDTWIVPGGEALDLLLVVDRSCSMGDELAAMAEHGPDILDYLEAQGWSYRIGWLDVYGTGYLQPVVGTQGLWLDHSHPNPYEPFRAMWARPLTHVTREAPLQSIYTSEADPVVEAHNRGYRRPGVPLHVVVVSDEDDQSITCSPYGDCLVTEFSDWLDASLSLITSVPGYTQPVLVTAANLGGGVQVDLLHGDWTRAVEEIGTLLTTDERRWWLLSRVPGDYTRLYVELRRSDGVTLVYEHGHPTEGYRYDPRRNAIELYSDWYTPERGDVVEVVYGA